MTHTKMMQTCKLCSADFQFGPHIYEGKHIARYNLTVCKECWLGNWDGWGPAAEGAFVEHMKATGQALPARNPAGWYPRD
jgi:hypothetical protein